jgi:CHAT domain-containing protein
VAPSPDNQRAFASVVAYAGSGGADVDLCGATRQALLQLKPLKEASKELQTVGSGLGSDAVIVTGAAFNDGAIAKRTDLEQYRVVYFATHGLLPEPGSCLPEPALLTSVGDGSSDGLLDVSKIIGLKLDADLVVLSACDTGSTALAGDQDAGGLGGTGEALGGLTRAFIYAGARSLLVSHWKIDSAATVRLMSAMFQAGQPTQAGDLQRATEALMDSPDQYSHPYYWAAFTIVGDGDRAMPR